MNHFPAMSGDTYKLAQASISATLSGMARLKNVPLSPEQADNAATALLEQMGSARMHDLAGDEELAAQRRSKAASDHLDIVAISRLMCIVMSIEGKHDANDPAVQAVTQEILSRFEASLVHVEWTHWPDLDALAVRYYGCKPRGPTVVVQGDGTVHTRWWLGAYDLHRDPKEGPAYIEEKGARRVEEYWVKGQLHRPPSDGPAFVLTDDRNNGTGPRRIEEYYVEGELHRPHQDGPAMIYTHYQKFDVSGEEYFENGKWHRPSELGPSVTHWDRTGEPVMILYHENGELHRDPKEGPAWWHVHDARTDREAARPFTEIRYCVRGQFHRDEKDGPALIHRDNETGVLVTEEYRRDGKAYREGGPSIIHRWPNGNVSFESYWHGEGFRDVCRGPSTIRYDTEGRKLGESWLNPDGRHRDAAEGPGCVNYDPSTGQWSEEFYVEDELRRAALGPATVTRDRNGNILREEFWDGERMRVKSAEPVMAEARAHG
jgi:hypothetical protein